MHATSTAHSSTINLVKTIVGAGLLAIPYAFKNDGVLVGLFLTLLAAVTSGFGLFVLAKCSKTLINPRNSSFFTLCMLTYPSLSPLFDFTMIIQCFGVGLSYLILIGDIFPGLFGGSRNLWIYLSGLLIVPLCFLKKLDHLKYSSIMGLIALGYLTLLVLGMFLHTVIFTDNYMIVRGQVNWFTVYDFKGLLSTFSIIIFAYTGAMNLFSIINELKNNSMENVSSIINHSISISTILFLTVGIAGYLTFGCNTLGNILLNYDADSVWVSIAKFCLAIMLVLSFPLLFHPLRIAVNNLVVWLEINYGTPQQRSQHYSQTAVNARTPIALSIEDDIDENVREEQPLLAGEQRQEIQEEEEEDDTDVEEGTLPGDEEQHTPFPNFRYYWITVLLLVSMYSLALNVRSFAFVLSIVGSTGSTSISFTLPGLFGYRLIGSDSLAIGEMISAKDRLYKRLSLLLTWFGLTVMGLSLYVTLFYGVEI
ncbi:hypothetical protein KAFR_0J01320 [Kazachstania africana CBS 2517]|uniref:Amino acid transporter transmembrane domain-containing protein n=1 Tax=Kazachstania africana (strain ATCC 22294 / BCRC 22015 / CBS 2517 / CECT 1963 / NBRC 1671 / NRRL Y-8276) TaxID=1071382 RepID=H2B0P9_KAZAF|nr:hypothetical protein KAFR_0J01320 [Kazachstania africana CBS 2517]CCF60199.1 hypothetical protein KAFR_0J01320 [Kazachstania africana CBS 2517]